MAAHYPPGPKSLSPLGVTGQFRQDPLGFLMAMFHNYGDFVTLRWWAAHLHRNSFAMMEARLILATMAQRYRLQLLPGHRVEPNPLATLGCQGSVSMQVIAW
jgi:hypothetical protein